MQKIFIFLKSHVYEILPAIYGNHTYNMNLHVKYRKSGKLCYIQM